MSIAPLNLVLLPRIMALYKFTCLLTYLLIQEAQLHVVAVMMVDRLKLSHSLGLACCVISVFKAAPWFNVTIHCDLDCLL